MSTRRKLGEEFKREAVGLTGQPTANSAQNLPAPPDSVEFRTASCTD